MAPAAPLHRRHNRRRKNHGDKGEPEQEVNHRDSIPRLLLCNLIIPIGSFNSGH
jgi:hypothetical protein